MGSYRDDEYSCRIAAAQRGEGQDMTDEDLFAHMVGNYPQFGDLPSMQDVIRHAICGGFAVRHTDGRLFLIVTKADR